MKDPIDHLLATAAQAPQMRPDSETPFGLETRVIAAWRETLAEKASDGWREFAASSAVIAALVTILSVVLNFHALQELPKQASQPSEFSVAESTIRLALNQ
jgi:hypothetical protein